MGKKKGSVDAEILVPYLVLVLATALKELYPDGKTVDPVYVHEPERDGFRVRLLLMEHFTIHRISMA